MNISTKRTMLVFRMLVLNESSANCVRVRFVFLSCFLLGVISLNILRTRRSRMMGSNNGFA